jgi:transposase
LQLSEHSSAPQIAKVVQLTPQAIRRLGHRYQQVGLESALYEKQRPGAAEVLDTNQKQRIIAMVCSGPPEGQARWTVTTRQASSGGDIGKCIGGFPAASSLPKRP